MTAPRPSQPSPIPAEPAEPTRPIRSPGGRRGLGWGAAGIRGVAVGYLAVMLALPLVALGIDAFADGPAAFAERLSRPDARHALWLTLWTAALAAAVNAVFGTLTAFVLVRCEFPGRRLLDAVIDLPFAIPTLVTGVMLVVLYGPAGAMGAFSLNVLGVPVAFAPPGIVLALLFTTFPFTVRTVQPVLMEMDADQEEAAATLGASEWQTLTRVVLPALLPAMLSGALLSFARALGEFGSIVMVAGNIPLSTQTAAVWVLKEIESENRRAASAMSVVLLAASFTLIVLTERFLRRREPAASADAAPAASPETAAGAGPAGARPAVAVPGPAARRGEVVDA